jgi:hypothetical protein
MTIPHKTGLSGFASRIRFSEDDDRTIISSDGLILPEHDIEIPEPGVVEAELTNISGNDITEAGGY